MSKKFATIVDTGSDVCLFHSSIREALGMRVKTGREGDLGVVIAGPAAKVYYHDVKLVVGTDALTSNLLGYKGFLENFLVPFDPSPTPSCFDIQRIYRS